MTLKEVLDMHIRTEQGLRFDVEYSYSEHDIETDELIDFVLIKTAEEAYQEWLADKDKPVEPNEMEVLLNELSEALLEAELRAVENEVIINETSNYVLDLDERLTNIELKK